MASRSSKVKQKFDPAGILTPGVTPVIATSIVIAHGVTAIVTGLLSLIVLMVQRKSVVVVGVHNAEHDADRSAGVGASLEAPHRPAHNVPGSIFELRVNQLLFRPADMLHQRLLRVLARNPSKIRRRYLDLHLLAGVVRRDDDRNRPRVTDARRLPAPIR